MELNLQIINEFVEYLKSRHQSLYRCFHCYYHQGHQIIYCPMCGFKMLHKIDENFLEGFKLDLQYDKYNRWAMWKYTENNKFSKENRDYIFYNWNEIQKYIENL